MRLGRADNWRRHLAPATRSYAEIHHLGGVFQKREFLVDYPEAGEEVQAYFDLVVMQYGYMQAGGNLWRRLASWPDRRRRSSCALRLPPVCRSSAHVTHRGRTRSRRRLRSDGQAPSLDRGTGGLGDRSRPRGRATLQAEAESPRAGVDEPPPEVLRLRD